MKHKGITLEHARGIEGPRAIYADENGFYRKPHEGATVEFHVHKDRWHPPFVTGDDVKPDDIIAVHHTWHETARYIEEDPKLLQEVIAGKHDGLLEKGTGKYNKAIRYIKHKYKGKTDMAKYVELQGIKDHHAPYIVRHNVSDGRDVFTVFQQSHLIASAMLSSDHKHVSDLHVNKEHRRKGIASALYRYIEKSLNIVLHPSPRHQTEDGKAFWAGRNNRKNHLSWGEGDLQHHEKIIGNKDLAWILEPEKEVITKIDDIGLAKPTVLPKSVKSSFVEHHSTLTKTDTQAIDDYKNDSSNVNTYLRNQERSKSTPELDSKVSQLDSITNHKIPEDTYVYRGSVINPNKFTVGHEFTDHGFTGTTPNPGMAVNFSSSFKHNYDEEPNKPYGKAPIKRNTIFKIHLPKGTKAHHIDLQDSDHADEEEILIRRGTRFKVTGHSKGYVERGTGSHKISKPIHVVHVEVVHQHEPTKPITSKEVKPTVKRSAKIKTPNPGLAKHTHVKSHKPTLHKKDVASLNIDTAAKPDFNYTVDKDGLVMLLPNTPQAEKIYNQIVKQVGAGKLLPQQFEALQTALKKAKYTLHKSKPSSSLLKDDEKLLRELGIDKADFDVASDYEFYKYGGDRGVSLSITKGGETKNYAIRKGEVFGVKPSMKGPTFSSVITKTTGERTVFTVSTSDLKRLLKASKKYSPENVNKEITPSHLALMHEAWKNAAPRLRGGKEAHLYVFTKWANIHTGVNIDVHDIYEALAYRRNKGLDQDRLSDKTYISSVNRGVKAFVQLFGRDLFEDAIVDLAKWIVTPRSKPSELAKNLMKLHDKRWKTSANQYVKIH